MDTNTCIRTRRSVRSFTEEPVSHALLEEIISVASYAPSWKTLKSAAILPLKPERLWTTLQTTSVCPFPTMPISSKAVPC